MMGGFSGFDFGCGRGFWVGMGGGAGFDGEVGLGGAGLCDGCVVDLVAVLCFWWWFGGCGSVLVLGCVDLVLGSGNGFG